MKQSEECYQKLLTALEKDELIEYLEGKGEYKVEFDEFTPGTTPTDISAIMTDGLYALYTKDPQSEIDKKLFDALKKMMKGDAFEIYMAADIVYDELLSESYGHPHFITKKSSIVPLLSTAINKNKDKLSHYFGCGGADYKNGVMGVLERWKRNAMEDWGFKLF